MSIRDKEHSSKSKTINFNRHCPVAGFVGPALKQSPAREAAAKSMRCIPWRGWLRNPRAITASLAMTIRFFFVIANPAGWP